MSSVNHILVPTDGSEGARKAAAFAADLARDRDVRITVVMVHSEQMLMPYAWSGGEWTAVTAPVDKSMDELRAEFEKRAADEEIAQTCEALGDLAKNATSTQLWGQAAEELCRYAVDNDVDLIVMGTRGRSSFGRLLLGSVSSQVANHANCPVTLVR